jgi:hypothetical protein
MYAERLSMSLSTRLCIVLSLACAAGSAFAQCDGQWQTSFANPGLFRNTTQPPGAAASIVWDRDGSGPLAPVLVVGGSFTTVNGVAANNVAIWDGSTWQPLGSGTNNQVAGFLIAPNGQGQNDLILVGNFGTANGVAVTGVARWNGTTFTQVGNNIPAGMGGAQVRAIGQLSDGRLVIVGRWGSALPNVAVLGASNTWQGLGGGVSQAPNTLAISSTGDLYVGGPAFTLNGSGVGGILRWTGSAWERPGSGVNGTVNVITPLSGGRIAVGGTFADFFAGVGTPGRIAIWNPNFGTANPGWSELANGVNGDVRSIIVLQDGSLLVGGSFTSASPLLQNVNASRLARWSGSVWTSSGSGIANTPAPAAANVATLCQLPTGEVFLGGTFDQAGGASAAAISLWTPPVNPQIVTGPVSTSVCGVNDVTFSATATQTEDVTYFWEYRGNSTFNVWVDVQEGPNYPFDQNYTFSASFSGNSMILTRAAEGTPWNQSFEFRVTVDNGCGNVRSEVASLTVVTQCCDSIDFNGNQVFPEDQDVVDFFEVLAGGACPTQTCSDIDFNNNGVFPEDQDVVDFFTVLAGGQCQ